MKKKIVIVGGGPSGLVAANTFKRCGGEVVLLEPGKLGGEFLSGGLKYIHKTEEMERLLERLDVAYSPYKVNGGILLAEEVSAYPSVLWGLPKERSEKIQADHYRKTRRTKAEDASSAMNDPSKKGPRRALRCDFGELIDSLGKDLTVISSGMAALGDNVVKLSNGQSVSFDFLVVTIPLWILRGMVDFYVPETVAACLNIAHVKPRVDKYVKWDYVYTPYTPADSIHRFSPAGSGYSMESNGKLDMIAFESDLNFIFPGGYAINTVREGLKGHLLPLDILPEWPENVAPIGRFAKWDSRSTIDVALEDSILLAERWFN